MLECSMTVDPTDHGFVHLTDFKLGNQIDTYECRNHAAVDGHVDLLRLNIYLSRDGAFVTIWNGLVEPWLAEPQFELSADLDLGQLYSATLFRGHIDTDADMAVILRCLRVTEKSTGLPNVLRGAPHDIRCEPL
jgi:hypothetical protein